jgi:phosphatidylglycerophosphatase A
VIDEWIGYWVSAAFLPRTPLVLGAAFILFRIVDTIKPLGIDRLGHLTGGWGVVLDDVAGGILVNAVLHFLPRF